MNNDASQAVEAYDEVFHANQNPRTAWRSLLRDLDTLGSEQILAAYDSASRMLEDDGVNTLTRGYPETAGTSRWHLDALPFMLDGKEWTELELGLQQRRRLLEALLEDIYGEQRVLREQLVPAALILTHPGYLRQAHSLPTAQLLLSATDLVRTSSGSFQVAADFTQNPRGLAFTMQNRRVTSRVFPTVYAEQPVARLMPFFDALRSACRASAPTNTESPLVVLSVPSGEADHFDHAYAANLMGFPLAEPTDFTVSGGKLFLRTLGKLEPVDVVMRRTNASKADPLDLDPQSTDGVPGMLEAARNSQVAVVNSIGAGVLEHPALVTRFGQLCREFLNEDLLLPSVPTWWCGDASSLPYVLENLSTMACWKITTTKVKRVIAAELSAAELEKLRTKIQRHPWAWTARHIHDASLAPFGREGTDQARLMLRTFAVSQSPARQSAPATAKTVTAPIPTITGAIPVLSAPQPSQVTIMQGALAALQVDAHQPLLNCDDGEFTKDVWVLQRAESHLSRALPTEIPRLLTPQTTLATHAASDVFWVGRLAERAESLTRLLLTLTDLHHEYTANVQSADANNTGRPEELVVGEQVIGVMLRALATYYKPSSQPQHNALLQALDAKDTKGIAKSVRELHVERSVEGSLSNSISRLSSAAQSVREYVSGDVWGVLSQLERALARFHQPRYRNQLGAVLGHVREHLLALSGIMAESMVRDQGWYLMECGRRLERLQLTSRLLRTGLERNRSRAVAVPLAAALLQATESSITYRRRYVAQAQAGNLAELLIADPTNPRSLAFQVNALQVAITQLPVHEKSAALIADLQEQLAGVQSWQLVVTGPDGDRPELCTFLDQIGQRAAQLLETVRDENFRPTKTRHTYRSMSTHATSARSVR